MVKLYCIEINLDKQRITFHYKGKPDKVIDKKFCMEKVEKDIDKNLSKKSEIDKMIKKHSHAKETQIRTSLVIPETSKENLIIKLLSKEGQNQIRNQIINKLHSEIKNKLSETLLKENIKRAINEEWLNDALQLIKG